jgi:hypothetical protein
MNSIDDTLKTPADVQQVLGLKTLAKVGRIDGQNYPDELVTAKQPLSAIASRCVPEETAPQIVINTLSMGCEIS